MSAKCLDRLVIAAADPRIADAADAFGAQVVEVFDDLPSGSDRVEKAVRIIEADGDRFDIVVNIQGDEPLLDPTWVDKVVDRLIHRTDAGVSTPVTQFRSVDNFRDPSAVKVILDKSGYALYFSRSPVPRGWKEDVPAAFLHVGLYAYRREILERFVRWQPALIEKLERLEQLRLLYNGVRIVTVEVDAGSMGVDTIEDLEKLRQLVKKSIVNPDQ